MKVKITSTKFVDGGTVALNATQQYYADQMFAKYGKVIMTDKANNKTYYGTKKSDGTWDMNEFEVLTGKASKKQGLTGLTVDQLDNRPGDRATPIGVFKLTKRTPYNESLQLGDTNVYYHETYVGADDPNRAKLFNNNNNEDNYRSYGCINCQRPSIDQLKKFAGDNSFGMVIDSRITPEENSKWMQKNTPTTYIPYTGPKTAAVAPVAPKPAVAPKPIAAVKPIVAKPIAPVKANTPVKYDGQNLPIAPPPPPVSEKISANKQWSPNTNQNFWDSPTANEEVTAVNKTAQNLNTTNQNNNTAPILNVEDPMKVKITSTAQVPPINKKTSEDEPFDYQKMTKDPLYAEFLKSDAYKAYKKDQWSTDNEVPALFTEFKNSYKSGTTAEVTEKGKEMNSVTNNMNVQNPKPATSELQKTDNIRKGDKAYWTAAYQELNNKLIADGKPGINMKKMNAELYQNTLAKEYPELLVSKIKSGEIPLTNKNRRELGTNATSYTQLTPEQQAKITNEALVSGFTDKLPGFRKVNLSADKFRELVNSDEFKAKTTEEQQAIIQQGNEYNLKNSDLSKSSYKKQALPFEQTIPELAGFASALNTYNYQTPDYTHWEVTPNKLNIQPQLQSIDSSLNAVNATTTGNPQVDYARKVGAFTQGLAAKQQAYGNKQNYDSTQEYEAQKINKAARTQEGVLDTNAMNTIYNEYMPAAKDAATAERIAAISSLSTKYALNEANENKKKMMLDNFYSNVRIGKDGKFEFINPYKTDEIYYDENGTPATPPIVTPSTPANKTTYSDVSPSITRVDKVTTNQAGDDAIFKNAEMRPMKPSRNVYGYNLPSIPNNKPVPTSPANKNYKAPINVMQIPFEDGGVTPIRKAPYKKGAPVKNEFPVRPIRIR